MLRAKRHLLRLWKTTQAVVANVVFGFPGRRLRLVGVTGTDGKTTTVHLIVTALESAGYTVGAISTIQYQVGTRAWVNASKLTTPGPWELNKLLAHMVRAGCHYAVIECSSHRLDQGGLWGLPFDVAVVTNITREHFDYHQNFKDYEKAKRRLFTLLRHEAKVLPVRRGADPGGTVPTVAVTNLDDERAAGMLGEPAEKKYGCTLKAGDNRQRAGGSAVVIVTAYAECDEPHQCVVRAGEQEALLRLQLPGKYNLQNALTAIAVGVSQGIELARVTRELSTVEKVPGRMERVEAGQPFTVIIDYAVTPAAFAALYAEVLRRKAHSAKLIHVFGSAGGRDRGKRPLLGGISAQHADLAILTDEDPFAEDPEQILDDIEAGMKRSIGNATFSYIRVRDRRVAVHEALKRAQPGDIVLVTGKGAEETMAVGKKRISWNDRTVIEEELSA